MVRRISKRQFLLLATVGYGFDIVLVSLVGWPGSSSAFAGALSGGDPFSVFMLAKNISFCLAFLLWFLLSFKNDRRVRALLSHPAAYWVFSGMVMIGTVLALGGQRTASVPVDALRGALLGCGVSGNFALWQRALCSRETPLDAQSLIAGTAFGAALYFVLVWLPDWLVCVLAGAVVAPVMSALLVRCSSGILEEPAPGDSRNVRDNFKWGILSLLMPCITIGAIGFSVQMVRLALPTGGDEGRLAGNLLSLALIVGSVILFVLFEKTRYRVNMDVFYLFCAPAIGIAFLPLPIFGLGYAYALAAGLYIVFTIASIMGILACNQVARHYSIPPIAIYSLAFGIIYTARYLPVFILGLMGFAGGSRLALLETLSLSLICVALMFAAYVVSDRYRTQQNAANVHSWESGLPEPKRYVIELSQEGIASFARKRGLTEREIEVLKKLREGRSAPYISSELGITENTVRFHCKNIYAKLEVHNRQDLFDLLDTMCS